MKKVYKRTFYYKYSLTQKLILAIPILSLVFLLFYPLNQEEAKIGSVLLFIFSTISLLMIIKKRNYIKWDLNEIEICLKGNNKIKINKDTIDNFTMNENTFVISFYKERKINLKLEGLKKNEKQIFLKTFKLALNETDKTEILFHNYNKMSLIYKDDF